MLRIGRHCGVCNPPSSCRGSGRVQLTVLRTCPEASLAEVPTNHPSIRLPDHAPAQAAWVMMRALHHESVWCRSVIANIAGRDLRAYPLP